MAGVVAGDADDRLGPEHTAGFGVGRVLLTDVDAQDIYDGGGNGQIIGRNTFQRPREQALEMLDKIINIFLGKVRQEPVAKAAE